ncbi:MAG: DUF1641 domain-containing protein [Candidatus Nanopelagicales bacterium]
MTATTLDTSLNDRLDRLSLQMTEIQEELAEQRRTREMLLQLTELSGPVMEMLTARMAELEAKGYFTFAQGGLEIADRVVTSFSEDDVRALGDNVVLILNTVKEMTQPEVMNLLSRTAIEVQEIEDAPAGPPPSTLALLKQMRDPDVRRGLARTLTVLRSLGSQPAAPTPAATAPAAQSPKE